jgi:hypothetical protein
MGDVESADQTKLNSYLNVYLNSNLNLYRALCSADLTRSMGRSMRHHVPTLTSCTLLTREWLRPVSIPSTGHVLQRIPHVRNPDDRGSPTIDRGCPGNKIGSTKTSALGQPVQRGRDASGEEPTATRPRMESSPACRGRPAAGTAPLTRTRAHLVLTRRMEQGHQPTLSARLVLREKSL